jgi:hypothetical protein
MDDNKQDTERKDHGSLRWVLLILVLLAIVALGAFFLSDRFGTLLKRGTTYTLDKTGTVVSLERDGATMTAGMGDLLLRSNKDGVQALAASGEVQWDIAYTMSRPYLCVAGSYAAVADRRGQTAILVDATGSVTRFTAEGTILFHTVNELGEVALVTSEDDGHTITLYDAGGNKLLKRRTYEKKDGVPVAIALSADGQRMSTSFLTYTGGSLASTLTIFDLSTSGASLSDRILGSKKFEGTLISDLRYMDKQCLYIGDDRLGAVDTTSGCVDSWEESLSYQIEAVAFTDEAVAIALGQGGAGNGEAADYDLWIYDAKGNVKAKKNMGGLTGLIAGDDVFVCSSGQTYTACDIKGSVRWYLDATEAYYHLIPFSDGLTVAAEGSKGFTYYQVTEITETGEES